MSPINIPAVDHGSSLLFTIAAALAAAGVFGVTWLFLRGPRAQATKVLVRTMITLTVLLLAQGLVADKEVATQKVLLRQHVAQAVATHYRVSETQVEVSTVSGGPLSVTVVVDQELRTCTVTQQTSQLFVDCGLV